MAATKEPGVMGRPREFRGPLRELVELFGNTEAFAEAIGVSVRTVRRWASGEWVPARPTRMMLAALAHTHSIEPPFGIGPTCPRPKWLDEEEEDD